MLTDFKKKQKRHPLRNTFLFFGAVALSLFLFFLAMDSWRLYQKRLDLATQISHLQNKIEDLKNKNESVHEAIAKENDDAYIEKVAREELGLQKSGEKVISFIMPEAQNFPVSTPQDKKLLPNWLNDVWHWLKNSIHY